MTQTQIVIDSIKGTEMSIKDISNTTGIKEPNVRRILWEGTKQWVFTRVSKWIYTITIGDKTKAIIKCWDSLKDIKKLKNSNYKFDMVFLDIPYKTVAVTGGNRWVKYNLITPIEFKEFLEDLKQVIKPTTHIYYMYSNAPSWWKQMEVYNNLFKELWYKLQAEWWWQKLFKNWKKCSNMRWDIMKREWLALYSLNNIETNWLVMDYESIRPRTASEKCLLMWKQLVRQSTKIWDRILDPFAWTWMIWEAALSLLRNVMIFEKSEERVIWEILPRLQKLI